MKKALLLLALAACAGEPEGYEPLDDAEFPLITQVSSTNEASCVAFTGVMFESAPLGGLSYGAKTCMTADKTVYVPRTKSVSLKPVQNSCSATHYNAMVAQLDLIIAELNTNASIGGTGGWTFTKSSSGTHSVHCIPVATSPTGAASIRSYVRVVPTQDTTAHIFDSDSVTDGALLLPWANLSIQVDVPDIFARGANATEDTRMLWQALAHGVEKLTGTGEFAGDRLAASDQTISGAAGRVMFSNGERCRARGFATTQASNLFWTTAAGCADN